MAIPTPRRRAWVAVSSALFFANMAKTIPAAATHTLELSVFTDALDLAFTLLSDGDEVSAADAESAAKVIGAAIIYANSGFAPEKADAFYSDFERHVTENRNWQADYGPRIAAMVERLAQTKSGYRQAAAEGLAVVDLVVRELPVQISTGGLAAAEAAYKK